MPETIGNAGMTEEERVVLALHVVARMDGGTPGQFLETLAYIVRDETWKKRGESLRHLLETPPPKGAGIAVGDVLRLIAFQHPHERDNAELHAALEVMRTSVRRELHEAMNDLGANQHAGCNNVTPSTRGNSSSYTLRRLRRDRPDLAERVLAGELKPHAAMVAAGFRQKTISVPRNVTRAAAALRRHFSAEERAALRALLDDD